MVKELCYRITSIPDLTLSKYVSLDGDGVDGVLEKHLAFLRRWNRKGVLTGLSFHLFYFFDGQDVDGNYGIGERGNKLRTLFLVRGEETHMRNVPELVASSPLSDYFVLEGTDGGEPYTFDAFKKSLNIEDVSFKCCSTLIKKEVFIKSSLDTSNDDGGYYTIPEWEMNEDGRLYNMLKTMEALDRRVLYRIDVYPTERADNLREALRKPMTLLRERQFAKGSGAARDFEADNVLRGYEEMLKTYESSPHFIVNTFVFGNDKEDTTVILDAAGAEALAKGNYTIATLGGKFTPEAFFDKSAETDMFDPVSKVIVKNSQAGLTICKEESQNFRLKFLPTLMSLEEVAPFFRLPTLFEGEVIQQRKETAPPSVGADDGLYLGRDDNGYDVFFPLKNLSKHAFIAGVPGSGKTNTMHHLTSTLWKEHGIPFLVLEPAKQEYRALANQEGMEDLHIFSPNADMLFPLHINPFEFPKGLMLAEHIRRLVSVFEGAFPLENPMPFLLDTAIEAVYRELGWTPDTVNTGDPRLKFPTMSILYKRLEEELKTTKYSDEISGNLESALKVRIGSLLRREMGDVFDVPKSTLAPEDWLRVPAIIELEAMGTGPANFLTLMLCALIREALKVNPHHDKDYARHVIFIEEAHNLIGPESEDVSGADANPKQAATAFVVKMLAEVRALKEGIIIADQLPTVMAQEVIKNTGLKIGLRITSADDRGLLGGTMAANVQQLEAMATFNTGRALVSYEGLMKPFTMQMQEWRGPGTDDCIANTDLRKDATTPKPDAALAEMLRDNAVYKMTCEKSFAIEVERFVSEFNDFNARVIATIEHFGAMAARERELDEAGEKFIALILDAKNGNNTPEDSDTVALWQRNADNIGRQREDALAKYKGSDLFKGSYNLLVSGTELVKRISRRIIHWRRLSISYYQKPSESGNTPDFDPRTTQLGDVISTLQGEIIHNAQLLFLSVVDNLADSEKVRASLAAVAEKLGFEVII